MAVPAPFRAARPGLGVFGRAAIEIGNTEAALVEIIMSLMDSF